LDTPEQVQPRTRANFDTAHDDDVDDEDEVAITTGADHNYGSGHNSFFALVFFSLRIKMKSVRSLFCDSQRLMAKIRM
jgi:hypothetical protein